MKARREKLKLSRSSVMIGCPLCNIELKAWPQPVTSPGRPQQ
jgi:hypothetical protein